MKDFRVEIIKDFNEYIEEFLEFLKILAPSNLKHKIDQIIIFKNANKVAPIQYFSIYGLPYKKFLDNNDFSYILNTNLITKKTDSSTEEDFRIIEEIIKSIWNKLSEDNKNTCIKHMKRLLKCSVDYVTDIVNTEPNGNKQFTMLILLEIMNVDTFLMSDKYHIMKLVTDKKIQEASQYINFLLTK